jgi:hypothetical protein
MTDLKSGVSTITNKDLLTVHRHMFNLIKENEEREEQHFLRHFRLTLPNTLLECSSVAKLVILSH